MEIPWSQKSENKTQLYLTNYFYNLHIFNTSAAFWGVLNCYDDHVDRLFVIIHFYELTLMLKAVFLLFLCSVSILYSSFQCLCATAVASFQISRKTHSKIFEKFLPAIFQTSKQSVKFSFLFSCSERLMNPEFSFFFAFLLLPEGKAHKQWSHPPHNDPYLRL